MQTLRSMRFATPFGGLAMLCLLIAAPVQATHPRPVGASPVRLSLVPAYSHCTAPNRTHGPPLAFPSCNPPAQTSAQATVGTPDAFGGGAKFSSYFLFDVLVGAPGPPDDSNVNIDVPLTDVRCIPTGARCGSANAAGPADYSGDVRIAFTIRPTDHYNWPTPGGGTDPGTVQDVSIENTWWPCVETASTSIGSTCDVRTSVESFLPGAIKDVKRSNWEIDDVRVYDGGTDGEGDTTADNTVFLRPGIFIP
jgi:hypothetical protein